MSISRAAFLVLFASAAATAQTPPAPQTAPATPPPAQTPAPAEPAPAAAPEETEEKPAGTASTEEIKKDVLDEVRREINRAREEIREEVGWVEADSEARAFDGEALDELKERLNFFQPHGYLRLRGSLFSNFDLNRGADPGGKFVFPRPLVNPDSEENTSFLDMRFRFAPVLEISEDMSISTTIDILDNLVLGSSGITDAVLPGSSGLGGLLPASFSTFSHERAAALVAVKRLWGRVRTPVGGELLFGRMGYHWGLGLQHNDGNCLTCDAGDTYDRVAFALEIRGHVVTPMIDFLGIGPLSSSTAGLLGGLNEQPFDLEDKDDGVRLAASVVRLDTVEQLRRRLDNDEWVLNYGALLGYRTQDRESPLGSSVILGGGTLGGLGGTGTLDPTALVTRSASLWEPDAWVSLQRRQFRVALETSVIFGEFRRTASAAGDTDPALNQKINVRQWGAALESAYWLLAGNALELGLDAGIASGDPAAGFGARPGAQGSDKQDDGTGTEVATGFTNPGDVDGPQFRCNTGQPTCTDDAIENFRFNRDYRVDLILWRQLLSRVTDAFYVRPHISYRPGGRRPGSDNEQGFELSAWGVYSQALSPRSVPANVTGDSGAFGLAPLGIELDGRIGYQASDRFTMALEYGVLFPLTGFRNAVTAKDASLAQTLRLLVAIPF